MNMVSNLIFIFEGMQKLKRISICLNLGFIKRATLIFTKVSYKTGSTNFQIFLLWTLWIFLREMEDIRACCFPPQ